MNRHPYGIIDQTQIYTTDEALFKLKNLCALLTLLIYYINHL
jgi:hypothetical protein